MKRKYTTLELEGLNLINLNKRNIIEYYRNSDRDEMDEALYNWFTEGGRCANDWVELSTLKEFDIKYFGLIKQRFKSKSRESTYSYYSYIDLKDGISSISDILQALENSGIITNIAKEIESVMPSSGDAWGEVLKRNDCEYDDAIKYQCDVALANLDEQGYIYEEEPHIDIDNLLIFLLDNYDPEWRDNKNDYDRD